MLLERNNWNRILLNTIENLIQPFIGEVFGRVVTPFIQHSVAGIAVCHEYLHSIHASRVRHPTSFVAVSLPKGRLRNSWITATNGSRFYGCLSCNWAEIPICNYTTIRKIVAELEKNYFLNYFLILKGHLRLNFLKQGVKLEGEGSIKGVGAFFEGSLRGGFN